MAVDFLIFILEFHSIKQWVINLNISPFFYKSKEILSIVILTFQSFDDLLIQDSISYPFGLFYNPLQICHSQ
jgi:hypothetical protein